jgi:hypothetical protein
MSKLHIILHIGPHKTGTTSIQAWLLSNQHELIKNGIYYPTPEKYGPGHVELAWELVGINNTQISNERINNDIAKALSQGADKLFISSEELSKGILNNSLYDFAKNSEFKIDVLITMNEYVNRLRSTIYETIKHGAKYDFEAFDYMDFIMNHNHPGVRPNFLHEVTLAFPNRKIVVMMVDKNNPNKIFEKIKNYLNLDISLPKNKKLNSTANHNLPTEIMNFFNDKLNLDIESRIALAQWISNLLLKNHNLITKFNGLETTHKENVFLNHLADIQASQLVMLNQLGKIELHV